MAAFWNRSERGQTVLTSVSKRGSLEIVEYILSFEGIDVFQRSPLGSSVRSGNKELLRFFVALFLQYSEFSIFEKAFHTEGILEIIEKKDLETLKVWRIVFLRSFSS